MCKVNLVNGIVILADFSPAAIKLTILLMINAAKNIDYKIDHGHISTCSAATMRDTPLASESLCL